MFTFQNISKNKTNINTIKKSGFTSNCIHVTELHFPSATYFNNNTIGLIRLFPPLCPPNLPNIFFRVHINACLLKSKSM